MPSICSRRISWRAAFIIALFVYSAITNDGHLSWFADLGGAHRPLLIRHNFQARVRPQIIGSDRKLAYFLYHIPGVDDRKNSLIGELAELRHAIHDRLAQFQDARGLYMRVDDPMKADLLFILEQDVYSRGFPGHLQALAKSFPKSFTRDRSHRHVFICTYPPAFRSFLPLVLTRKLFGFTFTPQFAWIEDWKVLNVITIESLFATFPKDGRKNYMFPAQVQLFPTPYFQLSRASIEKQLRVDSSRVYFVSGVLGRLQQFPFRRYLATLIQECPDCKLAGVDWPRSVIAGVFRKSVFCLQPPGDTATRASTFLAIAMGCIPVFFHHYSGEGSYPLHLYNSSAFSLNLREQDFETGSLNIIEYLRSLPSEQIRHMQAQLETVMPRVSYALLFEENDPPDALDLTIAAIASQNGIAIPRKLLSHPSLSPLLDPTRTFVETI